MIFLRVLKHVVAISLLSLTCTAIAAAHDSDDNPQKTTSSSTMAECSQPVWPEAARLARHTGTVKLALLIGTDGIPKRAQIIQSSGHAELDEAARLAFAKCKFKPGNVGGKPVVAWLAAEYEWTLD